MVGVFKKYHWPGNVRELENLLVRAAVVSKGHVLAQEDFPDLLESAYHEGPETRAAGVHSEAQREKGLETLDDIEERHIRKVIAKVGKNKGEICEILGISRPTLERKIEKYGIEFD
jgi:two-component system response regulator AtoC